MVVILGYEIAEDWNSYQTTTSVYENYEVREVGSAQKWWECPRCKHDFVFSFTGAPPWPPLSLPCPSCGRESPIPWPAPPMVAWTCQKCGHVQKASRRSLESPDKQYTYVYFESGVKTCTTDLRCDKCVASAKRGAIDEIFDVFDSACHLAGEFADAIRKSVGWETQAEIEAKYRRENQEKAQRAKRAFDRFLRKMPQIRAEQARLAEEKRQRAALEAKKRQEELRLLKKQARTAAGLKQMKPTNFELAVASLYLTLGYKVYVTPASRDQGIDLVAIKDKERIAVQCKRYKRLVPVSQVRDFYGSFIGTYTRGVFVTSSAFSKATRDWAEERQGLDLVDGQQLAKLFVEHNPKIVRNVEKWKGHPPGKK